MTRCRFRRPTAALLLSLTCACSKGKDSRSASNAHHTTQATDAAIERRAADTPVVQPLSEAGTTSQPRSDGGEGPTTPASPAEFEPLPWPPCNQKSRQVNDLFKTPWGTTPRDILNIALGSHRTTLTWQREKAFSYGVEGTSTTLRVQITRRGRATFVEGGSTRCIGPGPCMSWDCSTSKLYIPVHVKVVTDDGVIATQDDSDLVVSSRRYIETSLGESFTSHRGTLRIREIHEKGLSVPDFGIVLRFSPKRTMVGAIGGSYTIENVGGLFVEYACFPAKPPPELRGVEGEIGCRD